MSEYRQRIYGSYVEGLHPQLPREPRHKDTRYFDVVIRRHIPRDRNLVIRELGAGQGGFLQALEKHGYSDLVGYESAPQQISGAAALTKARLEGVDLWEALGATPDDSVDVIVAMDIIEHFSKDEAVKLLDEVFRVLKGGGMCVIHCPNAESPFFGRVRYGDITHETAYTRSSLCQLLVACGFDNNQCFEDIPIIHGMLSGMRWILWNCLRLCLRFYIAVETGYYGSEIVLSQNFLTIARKP